MEKVHQHMLTICSLGHEASTAPRYLSLLPSCNSPPLITLWLQATRRVLKQSLCQVRALVKGGNKEKLEMAR